VHETLAERRSSTDDFAYQSEVENVVVDMPIEHGEEALCGLPAFVTDG
jgi:hypothetical protein